ncbi:FeoA family protein [Tepidibacter mesophilus]|uniref:FeoA family protein n=1 Tax=Tepidibacter mesophilus TaxID=655607 RepID=UPI002E8E0489|nr:FeoA family protein [Tepidibacter mesophilus]
MAGTLVSEMINEACKFEGTKGYLMKNLSEVEVNVEYIIKSIETDDEDMESFLFTLGCYEGEKVTVISVLAENYVISVKDARYSIDLELAQAILI